MGNLIFVEGLPGTGKSTTAQFLARQLTRHGRPAHWIYEEEVPNPFVPEMPATEYRTWEDFADAHLECWRGFARDTGEAPETVVAESYLLQRPVFTMLRRDADPTTIEALINRFAGVVAPLRPKLAYLAHPDPERAWRTIAAKRGGAFVAGAVSRSEEWPFKQSRGLVGLDGVLAYWRAHAALCDGIVSWLPMETLVVDVTKWSDPERRARICEFVGVPADEPPAPELRALARFAGRYGDGEREIVGGVEDGRLVLRGALWPTNPLLPVAGTVFDVEAWPFQVAFDEDPGGAAGALRWQGRRLWWGGPEGIYTRMGDTP